MGNDAIQKLRDTAAFYISTDADISMAIYDLRFANIRTSGQSAVAAKDPSHDV